MSASISAAGNFGSPMQLLILLVIVLIFFGGSRLRNLGGDLGGAIKGFKKAMSDGEKEKEEKEQEKLHAESQKIIEGSVEKDKVAAEKDQHK
ncbi:MAG: twin-arginine translocase TatA/TatE family subunit [Gammaproteobacteria bacterium]|nr:MAG: twin-arginine translocase TatA/TatE family subunit [Gammaproteobacteria bacterium]